jgi:uncharacterized cofD-like protein
LVFGGLLLLALAVGLVIRELYRDAAPGSGLDGLLNVLSLAFLEPWLRTSLLAVGGVLLLAVGGWGLMRGVLEPFRARDEPLAELLYQRRWRARGPRVVAIGGGRGLSVLLRGLKEHTSNITAVVTMADDGGSSGVLRREMGIPPMGDIRDCIAALADAEPQMTDLLLYRFRQNGGGSEGLGGHALGNLLIAALTDIAGGDFEEGVRLANRVLAVRGKVVPVVPIGLTLHARCRDGSELTGQQQISRRDGIDRIWLSPDDVTPSAEALAAIDEADLIVLGPGSLYTSIIAGLLLPRVRIALAESAALRVYICNVATQLGETARYALSDHLDAFRRHDLLELIDIVLANDNFAARAPQDYPAEPVRVDIEPDSLAQPRIVLRDIVDDAKSHHHDSQKLAAQLMEMLDSRTLARQTAVVEARA